MKLLRKTIRKIILENIEYFDKLIVLLTSQDIENVKEGILLGEEMEYLTVERYDESDRSGWSDGFKRYLLRTDPRALETQYQWTLKLIPAFQERFMELHPEGVHNRYPDQDPKIGGKWHRVRIGGNNTVLVIEIAPGYV